jgi:protein SCO1/2
MLALAAVFAGGVMFAGLCVAADGEASSFKRTEAAYSIPEVTLLRQDGAKVSLPKELDDGRPVIASFIFTSCAAICPIITRVMSQVQAKLGGERGKVHMMSISIDPEQDTPARLREYAKKFKAGPGWQFYTGTTQAIIDVQKAFDAYRGDKDSHIPLIFMRAAPGKPWVRIDGFASPDELIREYHGLVGRN